MSNKRRKESGIKWKIVLMAIIVLELMSVPVLTVSGYHIRRQEETNRGLQHPSTSSSSSFQRLEGEYEPHSVSSIITHNKVMHGCRWRCFNNNNERVSV